MPITLDELIESAASGVLRAMNARGAGEKNGSPTNAASLVQAGFNVDFHIRAGGRPFPFTASTITADLNPQPLPPYHEN